MKGREMGWDEKDAGLLLALQRGLPLEPRPFARLGANLNLTEAAVIERVRALFDTGVARRLGGVFDPGRFGFRSTLCAAALPEEDLDALVPQLTPHPGITHCYLRTCADEALPNLWFTLTAPVRTFDGELAKLRSIVAPHGLLDLPALRRFKIDVMTCAAGRMGAPPCCEYA